MCKNADGAKCPSFITKIPTRKGGVWGTQNHPVPGRGFYPLLDSPLIYRRV
jgi:hypothetical protein